MLLCSRHHDLVHEGGFTIERDFQNRWFIRRPDGRAIPACGYRVADVIDGGTIDEDTIDEETGEISGLFNNPPAGGLLTGAKTFAADLGPALREPAAPAYWH